MIITKELENKAIGIMKKEKSFGKFKRLALKGQIEKLNEMMEDIIVRHNLNKKEW